MGPCQWQLRLCHLFVARLLYGQVASERESLDYRSLSPLSLSRVCDSHLLAISLALAWSLSRTFFHSPRGVNDLSAGAARDAVVDVCRDALRRAASRDVACCRES